MATRSLTIWQVLTVVGVALLVAGTLLPFRSNEVTGEHTLWAALENDLAAMLTLGGGLVLLIGVAVSQRRAPARAAAVLVCVAAFGLLALLAFAPLGYVMWDGVAASGRPTGGKEYDTRGLGAYVLTAGAVLAAAACLGRALSAASRAVPPPRR